MNVDPAEVPDTSAVILIDHASDVRLAGNTLTDPGPFYKHFVTVTNSCSDVTQEVSNSPPDNDRVADRKSRLDLQTPQRNLELGT